MTIEAVEARQTRLLVRLQAFDRGSALAAIGGLMTFPESISDFSRLELIAHLAASHCRGSQLVSLQEIEFWLTAIRNDPEYAVNDFPTDVFVSNITSSHGNFRLLEGAWSTNDEGLQYCVDAAEDAVAKQWLKHAIPSVVTLLRVSELVAARSGLRRFAEAIDGSPFSPSALPLVEVCQRVTFSVSELQAEEIDLSTLSQFIFDLQIDRDSVKGELYDTTFHRKPLILLGDQVVVALPAAIGNSIRQFLLTRAMAANELSSFQDDVFDRQCLSLCNLAIASWKIELEGRIRGTDPCLRDFLGTFDVGSYVHLIFTRDNWDPSSFGLMSLQHDYSELVWERALRVFATLAKKPDFRRGMTLIVHCGLGRGVSLDDCREPRNWRFNLLNAQEFRLLAVEENFWVGQLWKLQNYLQDLGKVGIEVINPSSSFLNVYAFAQHQGFSLLNGRSGSREVIPPGHETVFRVRMRTSQDRHAAYMKSRAKWYDVERFTTSTRFGRLVQKPLYRVTEVLDDAYVLGCVRSESKSWWLRCHRDSADDHLLAIVAQIWSMAFNWLARIAEVIEELKFVAPTDLTLDLTFLEIDKFKFYVADPAGANVDLAVSKSNGEMHISCPHDYLHLFARAANDGDRSMVTALARAVLWDGRVSDDVITEICNRVLDGQEARFVHLLPAKTATQKNFAIAEIPAPRLVQDEDDYASRCGISRLLSKPLTLGPIALREIPSVLRDAVDAMWRRVSARLEKMERRSVIVRALENHAAIIKDRQEAGYAAAAVLALSRDKKEIFTSANLREDRRTIAATATRALVEMAICASPIKGQPCGVLEFDAIISDIALLVELATYSDAIHYRLIPLQLSVQRDGSFDLPREALRLTAASYVKELRHRRVIWDAREYSSNFDYEPTQSLDALGEFFEVFTAEYGVHPKSLVDLLTAVTEQANEVTSSFVSMPWSALVKKLQDIASIDQTGADLSLQRFALRPREKWDEKSPLNAVESDWYPWRYNRRLSLMSRPIVRLTDEPDAECLISPHLLELSLVQMLFAEDGSRPAQLFDSQEMISWIGKASDRRGHAFNLKVAERLKELGFSVRAEVEMATLLGRPDLGDIDVLAWKPESNIFWLIECKSLNAAKSMGEMGERIREYSLGDHKKKSPSDKHLARIKALNQTPLPLEQFTSLTPSGFVIRSALVTDGLTPLSFFRPVADLFDKICDLGGLDELR